MRTILFALFFSFSMYGYFSTVDTGDIQKVGQYRLALAPQFILSDGSGMNLTSHFDTGVSDSGAIRVALGAGSTDFHTGLFYKWVPIPDTGDQPAIGLRVGVIWARDGEATSFSSRLHPILSKKFDTNYGLFNTYASLPIGITAIEGEALVPIHLVLGSEWKTLNYKNVNFGGEVGLNVDEAFSYLSLFAVVYFDEEKGIRFE